MVMEQLTEDAVQAKKHGLSYGQYIQKFKPPKPPAERFPKKKPQAEKALTPTEQPKVVLCAICGTEIPTPKETENTAAASVRTSPSAGSEMNPSGAARRPGKRSNEEGRDKKMAYFCKWWNCPLEQVDEHQSAQCEKDGRTCVRCMEQADEEEDAGQ